MRETPGRSTLLPTPYRRGGWVLFALVVLYVFAWLCGFVGASNGGSAVIFVVGILLLVTEGWGLFAVDARGYASLYGLAPWSQLSTGKKALLVCGFYFTPEIMTGIYLWRAVRAHYQAIGQTPRQQVSSGLAQFRQRSRGAQVGIVAVTLVVVIALCGTMNVLARVGPPLTALSTPSSSVALNTGGGQVQEQAATDTPLPIATATSKPTETPQPTATPPPPTATPCPTPCNPWGYNFSSGNLIYNPPANFCDYFNCIPSFWQSTNGYVMECQDATFSHSGGRSGSCSHHGGNWRPLYSH